MFFVFAENALWFFLLVFVLSADILQISKLQIPNFTGKNQATTKVELTFLGENYERDLFNFHFWKENSEKSCEGSTSFLFIWENTNKLFIAMYNGALTDKLGPPNNVKAEAQKVISE